MPILKSIVRIAPLALLVVLVGCKSASRRGVEIEGADLANGRSIAIDVSNFNGDVSIEASEFISEPSVKARLRAPGGRWLRRKSTEKKGVWIGAEMVEDQGGLILRVLSRPSADVPGSEDIRVKLAIKVPACGGVLVRNSGGRVDLRGVSGALQVDNGVSGSEGGPIDVRTVQTIAAPIALTTTDGHVYLQIGTDSRGALDVASDDGNATVRARVGVLTDVEVGDRHWRGVLNGGDNPIMLRSADGDARILVIENADTFQPTSDD